MVVVTLDGYYVSMEPPRSALERWRLSNRYRDQPRLMDISHRHMQRGFVDSAVSTAGLLLVGKSEDLLQVQHEGQGESS